MRQPENRSKELDMIGNINFNNFIDAQSIYASQLYGTFFMIYIRLLKDQVSSAGQYVDENGKEFQKIRIKKAHIKIQNYKGHYNLGITERIEFVPEGQAPHENGGKIKIEIQALSGSTNWEEIDINQDFIIGRSYLLIDRRLKPMHYPINSTVSNQADFENNINYNISMKNHLFDTEFFFRQGTKDAKKRSPSPGHWYSKDPIISSGNSCPGSINMSLFY